MGVKEGEPTEMNSTVKEARNWGRKVKDGVKEVGVKEVKKDHQNTGKQATSTSFFLHPHAQNIGISYFLLSFTPTYTHAPPARVRVRPCEGVKEGRKFLSRH